MLHYLLLSAALILFVTVGALWKIYSSAKVRKIPGPKPSSKEQGNLLDISRAGSFSEFLIDLHAEYGPIAGFWYGQIYTVSIASPQLFKQHSSAFDRPRELLGMFEILLGSDCIQFANGEEGRRRRQFYDRAFAHDKLCTYFDLFQNAVNSMIKEWDTKTEYDHIPLCEETFKFSVRTSLLTILGDYFQDDELVRNFREAYVKVQDTLNIASDPTHPERDIKMKEFQEGLDYMKATVQKAVDHRRGSTGQGSLIIDSIIEYAPSEDIVKGDSLTYMVGSFHSLGYLLAWCIYFLALHEDCQQRVYNEIIEVLGHDDLVDDSNLKRFSYMRQVINETCRCGFTGAFAARCQSEHSQLGGYAVPKNTPVIHALGVVMQDEKLWPSPTIFDPDRFNEENTKKRHPYAFSIFGFAGKRKCPAYNYVYLESIVFLATVLRRYQIQLQGEQRVKHVHGVVTHPSEEIWIRLIKRR